MSEAFADTIYSIINVKMQVAGIALVLTALAALFIKNATDSTGFAALFVPAMALGCLLGVYGCKMSGIVISATNKDSNIIATAGFGMVVAFIVMLVVVRLGGIVRDFSRPINLDGRLQDLE
jgi:hypothetical protein